MLKKKSFHLKKKPYSYKLDDDSCLVLLGNSEWDSERAECKLTFFYKVSRDEKNMNLDAIFPDENILGIYRCRSGKFKTGNFTDFDSQRYIKSRYRDIIRLANRQRNESDVLGVLDGLITAQHDSNSSTSEDNNDTSVDQF